MLSLRQMLRAIRNPYGMLRKAELLAQRGVTKLDENTFYVKAWVGVPEAALSGYLVKRASRVSRFECCCKGYGDYGMCSHVVAVLIYVSGKAPNGM